MESWPEIVEQSRWHPQYVTGFATGVAVTLAAAFVLLSFAGRLVAFWNRLLMPFLPTKQPGKLPVVQGPSPLRIIFNFLVTALILIVAVAGVLSLYR
jgi:hypothetical protein